eukprot:2527497-Rhodomonas_salina.2
MSPFSNKPFNPELASPLSTHGPHSYSQQHDDVRRHAQVQPRQARSDSIFNILPQGPFECRSDWDNDLNLDFDLAKPAPLDDDILVLPRNLRNSTDCDSELPSGRSSCASAAWKPWRYGSGASSPVVLQRCSSEAPSKSVSRRRSMEITLTWRRMSADPSPPGGLKTARRRGPGSVVKIYCRETEIRRQRLPSMISAAEELATSVKVQTSFRRQSCVGQLGGYSIPPRPSSRSRRECRAQVGSWKGLISRSTTHLISGCCGHV